MNNRQNQKNIKIQEIQVVYPEYRSGIVQGVK